MNKNIQSNYQYGVVIKFTAALVLFISIAITMFASLPSYASKSPSAPVAASGLTTSGTQTCVKAENIPYCWGGAYYWSPGMHLINNGALSGKSTTWLSALGRGGCAIAEGKPYCWGENYYGELGNDSTDTVSAFPSAVKMEGALSGKTVTALYHGTSAPTRYLVADGELYSWGSNWYDALGTGTSEESVSHPMSVSEGSILADKSVTQISQGANFTCAIADAKIYCWGENVRGQLGDGTTEPKSTPVAVDMSGALAGKTIASISAYGENICAIASNQLYCWGDHYNLISGVSGVQSTRPVAMSSTGALAGKTITSLSRSSGNTCVVASGELFCWGSNSHGGVGNNAHVTAQSPVNISATGALAGKTVTKVHMGTDNVCALADGDLYCWGNNNFGAVGNGTVTPDTDVRVPTAVIKDNFPELGAVTDFAVGDQHVCAIVGGGIYCWGNGANGSLGSDVIEARGTPTSAIIFKEVPEINGIDTYGDVYVNTPDQGIVVYGADFQQDVTVTVGGVAAAEVGYSYDGSIGVTLPVLSTPGAKDIVITNGNGESVTGYGAITYAEFPLPKITSITPNTAYTNISAQQFLINGINLSNIESVQVGDQAATFYVDYSGTQITVAVPESATLGAVDVTIEDNYGNTDTLAGGLTYAQLPQKKITNIGFSTEDGKTVMTITGTGLIGVLNPSEYYDGLVGGKSFVSLNGSALDFCTDGTGYDVATLESFGIMTATDTAPCYYLIDSNAQPVITPTAAKVYLDQNFDTTAQGTVSVNGSDSFTYNSGTTEPTDPGNPVAPTASVGNKSLTGTPTISKRPTFSGVAEPGSVVTVTVHSDPISCTTTTDADGNWSCTLPSDLQPGQHTVYIRIVAPGGAVTDLGPYAVTVPGATTITNQTPLAPMTGEQRIAAVLSPQVLFIAAGAVFTVAVLLTIGYTQLKTMHTRARTSHSWYR